jgi:hypothetical protein
MHLHNPVQNRKKEEKLIERMEGKREKIQKREKIT